MIEGQRLTKLLREGIEQFVHCRSKAGREKEAAMLGQKFERLLSKLEAIDRGLRKRASRNPGAIERRICRWLGRYTGAVARQMLGTCARQLLNEVATLRSMDVMAPVKDRDEVRMRVVAKPDRPVAELLHRLGVISEILIPVSSYTIKKSHEHTLGGPAEERNAMIAAMRENYPITDLCDALGMTRSGYHAAARREVSRRGDQKFLQ